MISVAICVVIFVFSSQNGNSSGSVSEGITRRLFPNVLSDDAVFVLEKFIRKAAHYGIYFILGITVYYSTVNFDRGYCDSRLNVLFTGVISVILCFMYSLTDEFHQSFIPGRHGAFRDCLLDTVGALSGVTAVILMSAVIKKFRKK